MTRVLNLAPHYNPHQYHSYTRHRRRQQTYGVTNGFHGARRAVCLFFLTAPLTEIDLCRLPDVLAMTLAAAAASWVLLNLDK